MRICLIIPPSPFLLDERVFPSLGVLKVAAVLERAQIPVSVLDLSGVSNYMAVVEHYARTSGTLWYGLTVTTPQAPAAFEIAKRLKELLSDSKLVVGGPHPTLVSAASKRGVSRAVVALDQLLKSFDTVVAGDGEKAILEALKWQSRLIDADDAKSPLFLSSAELELLPPPARHLIDFDSYHYTIDGVKATSLIAQLGCPFGCFFCGGRDSAMLRRVRTRTSDSVVRELLSLYESYGVRGFMFYDDELNVNKLLPQLMRSVRKASDSLGTEFRLRGFVKSELFNAEQAEAMYSAGFRWLLVGFESGSSRMLRNMNKKATVEDNTRCVEIAKSHGLKVKALMSIGHPGESKQTIEATKDWLVSVKPDDFDVTVITTYPGTPYYDRAVLTTTCDPRVWTYTHSDTGDKLHSQEVDYSQTSDYYKGDPNGGYVSHVFTDYLSPEDIAKLRDSVERDVREELNIPFNTSRPAIKFEHSMGQGIPATIYRST